MEKNMDKVANKDDGRGINSSIWFLESGAEE